MKLITNPKEYKNLFITLLNSYKEYYFATAWAGMPKEVVAVLKKYKARISKIVVGIHFYQTHPDFFDSFLDTPEVRHVLQPEGIFHPKIFLFKNSYTDWHLLIGSANFTESAFTKNSEASISISSTTGDSQLLDNALQFVNAQWESASVITDDSNKRYRERWEILKKSRAQLATTFGYDIHNGLSKDIMLLSWEEYVKMYKDRKKFERRFYLLDYTRSLFKEHGSFSNITTQNRTLIAGMSNHVISAYPDIFMDFGTNTWGKFRTLITNNDTYISRSINAIPQDGIVTEVDYKTFLQLFLQAPGAQITWVASATRLLVMKRPDIFFSMTGGNKHNFCEAFGIVPSRVNLMNYWELVIERIHSCTWYQRPKPKNKVEEQLKNARAAMLDVLYY